MGAERDRVWTELEVRVPETLADTVADYLYVATGRGVCLHEENGLVHIQGYISPEGAEDTIQSIRNHLDSLAGMGDLPRQYYFSLRHVDEEDWLSVFRAQHTTVRVSDRLVVRPSWCAPGKGREVVLDPGMAFGTGSHATTLMCLKLLDSVVGHPVPERMFDLGTGSGILAISAAFLGVRDVLAVDVDPEAVRTARENAAQNGVDDIVTIVEGSLEKASGQYDLIAANLSTALLKRLADPLRERLRTGGHLILSGVLKTEKEELMGAFEGPDLAVERILTEDIWLAGLLGK